MRPFQSNMTETVEFCDKKNTFEPVDIPAYFNTFSSCQGQQTEPNRSPLVLKLESMSNVYNIQ